MMKPASAPTFGEILFFLGVDFCGRVDNDTGNLWQDAVVKKLAGLYRMNFLDTKKTDYSI